MRSVPLNQDTSRVECTETCEPVRSWIRPGLRTRWLLAGLLAGVLISSVGLGHAKHETQYQQAKRIIYAVFPDSTQAAALRVVGCETGGTYWSGSHNASGATGYFQILQGNGGRTFSYKNMRFTIKAWKLRQPWHNAAAAFWLSHGGRDWHEWVCQP